MKLLESPFLVSSLLVGLSSFCFGFFVLIKNPRKRINQLWFLFSLTVAIWGFGGLWGGPEQNPASALLKWRITGAVGITWIPVLYLHFIYHFLEIKRPGTLFSVYSSGVIFGLLYPTSLIFSDVRFLWNEVYWPVAGPLHPIHFLWWTTLIFYVHWELLIHYRKYEGIRKSQIKLFFLASAIGYFSGVLEYLPDYKIDLYPYSNFGIVLYPFIMMYAILQYQLFDISLVIRRSLVYSLLITFLTTGYFGLIYGVERLFQTTLGYQSIWTSLASFALMAFLFNPLKNVIQRLVDRLIFRAPLTCPPKTGSIAMRVSG